MGKGRRNVFAAIAVVAIVAAAVLAFATRFNPLWMLVAGGILGFAGVI